MRHVRLNGFRMDKRMRMASKRMTVSDGRTFCGAEGTPDDTSKEVALATLRIAAVKKIRGHRDEYAEELCPACLDKLPREG